MLTENKIEKWVEAQDFLVNKRWGAVGIRAKETLFWLLQNTNLNLKHLLLNTHVQAVKKGKEEDILNVLYIFIKTINIGTLTYPKVKNIYICIDKKHLKRQIRNKLFTQKAVQINSSNLKFEE
jgi:hypothetical protein